jgi:hypothetical protein
MVKPVPSEELSQVAMSAGPGAVPPAQLAPSFRLVPVAALLMGAAAQGSAESAKTRPRQDWRK